MAKRPLQRLIQALLTFGLIFPSISFAQESAPSTLYMWTSGRGLERWARMIDARQGVFVLKPITQSIFSITYPQFDNSPGLFAWTNVATGMGAITYGAQEWYAREDKSTQDPARLVKITLKLNTQQITVNTYADFSLGYPQITRTDSVGTYIRPGDGTGLILHKLWDSKTNQLVMQEYILVKRGFIAAITADPLDTNPEITAAIQRLRDPKPFQTHELHYLQDADLGGFNTFQVRQQAIHKLERALTVPSSRLPPLFRSQSCTRAVGY